MDTDISNVRRLELRAGDVIVVTVPPPLEDEQVLDQIRSELRQRFPRNEILLLTGGAELAVVSEHTPAAA